MISEAALVHLCGVFPGPALMEMLGKGNLSWPYLTEGYDFRNGKLYPNRRPGFGVAVDTAKLIHVLDVTERYSSIDTQQRPDGSVTNW